MGNGYPNIYKRNTPKQKGESKLKNKQFSILALFLLIVPTIVLAGNFNESFVYTTYTNHTFGFYMAVVAILTLVFIMFERSWRNK
jgi:polyferredoxin